MDKSSIDYSPLLSGVLTVSDRDMFLGQLDKLEEEMFKQPVLEVLESVFPYARKAAFVNLLHEEKIESSDVVKIQGVIRGIRDYMGNVPVLSLTLAQAPREALLQKIAMVVSDQTQQPLFLDISIDSSILGGSKLSWGGKVEDFSLEKRLEEYFGSLKKDFVGKTDVGN